MRQAIVLLGGELGPGHGGAGGEAAAGSFRRCPRICTGARCRSGEPCEAAGTGAMLAQVGRLLLLLAFLGGLASSSRVEDCGAGCTFITCNCTDLVFKQNLAWGELFCPALESFSQSSFLALRVLSSQENCLVSPSLLQRGYAGKGLSELSCQCLGPGIGARVLQGAKLQSLKMSCLSGFVLC